MSSIVTPKQIYTYEQMMFDIEMLLNSYSTILNTEIIGKSVEGRDIIAIQLGHGKNEVFINGSHHAREWLSTALIMHMIDTYCEAFSKGENIGDYSVQSLLENVSIWFVPMVNPDGVTLVQKGHVQAKNPAAVLQINNDDPDFSAWKANSRGVDLNRQYPAGWETIENDPGKPAPSMYKGPKPLSEPEVQAIYHFTLAHDFKFAIAYHSSGEEIFWKYRSSGELLEMSYKLATLISKKTGYELVFPGNNPSGGGFTDWFLDVLKKPSFTLEISPLVGPRPVPLKNYDKIWRDNKEIGLLLAEQAILQ